MAIVTGPHNDTGSGAAVPIGVAHHRFNPRDGVSPLAAVAGRHHHLQPWRSTSPLGAVPHHGRSSSHSQCAGIRPATTTSNPLHAAAHRRAATPTCSAIVPLHGSHAHGHGRGGGHRGGGTGRHGALARRAAPAHGKAPGAAGGHAADDTATDSRVASDGEDDDDKHHAADDATHDGAHGRRRGVVVGGGNEGRVDDAARVAWRGERGTLGTSAAGHQDADALARVAGGGLASCLKACTNQVTCVNAPSRNRQWGQRRNAETWHSSDAARHASKSALPSWVTALGHLRQTHQSAQSRKQPRHTHSSCHARR